MKNREALDRESFQELYKKYANFAIRTAIAITRNPELAKDAVQETFIRVYRNFSSYDTQLPFEPWLYRILLNECNRLLKKEAKMTTYHHPGLENDERLSAASSDAGTELIEIIQNMEDLHRIPLILKYINGFSEKEIADILELNQNTVKSRLFKGRQKLRRLLELTEQEANRDEQYR